MNTKLWSFYKSLIKNPRSMGTPVPSSKYLAKAMASFIPIKENHLVIELGPGTGAITRALIKKIKNPKNIIAIERSKDMADKLRTVFPEITVLHGDATQLVTLLTNYDLPICAIVSSLPLLMIPVETKKAILEQAEHLLSQEGRFIQFTYGPIDPASEYFKNLKLIDTKKIWRNLPPARVYVYSFSKVNNK